MNVMSTKLLVINSDKTASTAKWEKRKIGIGNLIITLVICIYNYMMGMFS